MQRTRTVGCDLSIIILDLRCFENLLPHRNSLLETTGSSPSDPKHLSS
jgi:hypothetical protein